jgi:hypothetical protein
MMENRTVLQPSQESSSMTLKLRLILATVAVSTLPEMAHACTGNACDYVTPTTKIENKDGNIKVFIYTLFNKDKDRRIGAIACIIWNGTSCIPAVNSKNFIGTTDTFEYRHRVIIDPGKTANSADNGQGLYGVLPGEGDKRQPYLDIQSAVFLDPPRGSGQQQGSGQRACGGDACNSVIAGSWSNGTVSITDKDTSGKISVKICFKNTNFCNPWGINPGVNSVALPQPKPPLPDTSVEIIEANYSQKPTQASSSGQQQGGGQKPLESNTAVLTVDVINRSVSKADITIWDENDGHKIILKTTMDAGREQRVKAVAKPTAVMTWKAVGLNDKGFPYKSGEKPRTKCGRGTTSRDDQKLEVSPDNLSGSSDC